MNSLPLSQIAQLAGGSISSGDQTVVVNKVSTDSRTLKSSELFVALRGENFDGHNFVESAAQIGAAGAIVESTWNGEIPKNFALIRAKDTLQAYQDLAANYRKSLAQQGCDNRKQHHNHNTGHFIRAARPHLSSHANGKRLHYTHRLAA